MMNMKRSPGTASLPARQFHSLDSSNIPAWRLHILQILITVIAQHSEPLGQISKVMLTRSDD